MEIYKVSWDGQKIRQDEVNVRWDGEIEAGGMVRYKIRWDRQIEDFVKWRNRRQVGWREEIGWDGLIEGLTDRSRWDEKNRIKWDGEIETGGMKR